MGGPEKSALGAILLAEDEELVRWSIKSYLQARGYDVVDCADGPAALDRAAATPFDVLIADLRLPGADGLTLASAVRRALPECQVIITTGHSSKEAVIESLRQGVFDYLEKPFALELLLIRVEKAMEKNRMLRELVRLARTDGLTGLFNQRYFYEVLEKEMSRGRRQGRPLSLILADVDNFKVYNDRLGHLGGDEALVAVAGCLRRACRRDVDVPFRYGGDEFIIVLPEAGLAAAEGVAGRIRRLMKAAGPAGLTLSIGLAELEAGQDIRTFIRHADEAMYLAKQMGGDRAVAFAHRA